jgi:hypothetical protein
LNDPKLELVQQMHEYFGGEVIMHLEFIKVNGVVIPAAIQIVRFTDSDRLNEIIAYHESQGVFIANPHTYILEDGGSTGDSILFPDWVQKHQFRKHIDYYKHAYVTFFIGGCNCQEIYSQRRINVMLFYRAVDPRQMLICGLSLHLTFRARIS